jgi:hypothetical protein
MSTKTTFKRIALVAVAALGFGMLSVVPSSAVDSAANLPFYIAVADTGVQAAVATTGTATGIAGTDNYVSFRIGAVGAFADLAADTKLTLTTTGAGSSIKSISAGAVAWTYNNATAPAGTPATAVSSPVQSTSANLADDIINVGTPEAGTITVVVTSDKLNTVTGVTTKTAIQAFTITVAAASVVGVLSVGNSKSYITDSATVVAYGNAATSANAVTAAALLTADAAVVRAKGAAGTPALVGMILVTLKDTQTTPIAMKSATLAASISGAGLITGNGAADGALVFTPARVATSITDTVNGVAAFGVYSDGSAGTGTITITYTKSGVTTTVATETVSFYGGISTLTVLNNYNYLSNSGSEIGSVDPLDGDWVIRLTALDSVGTAARAGTVITATPADLTKVSSVRCDYATVSSTGRIYCAATAVAGASGVTTIKFSTGSAAGFNLVEATGTITVSSVKAASFKVTGSTDAEIGGVITYTIEAKDANGNPVADGTSVESYLLGNPTVAGGALTDNSSTADGDQAAFPLGTANAPSELFDGVYFWDGKATDSVQAPFGATTIKATFLNNGAGIATSGGTYFADAATRNQSVSISTTVANSGSQAAVDAAAEATDAANAATDAANAAAEAADAATAAAQDASDAVAALAASVAEMMVALRKQITALTNIIVKIQKKVKA